jgi:UDP-N-acetylglucosamine 3-dehydrogenase
VTYTVGFIGTGDPEKTESGTSSARAHEHAKAYAQVQDCELVGCADIVRENAETFAETFDLPEGNVFEDYREMLQAVDPDVVSVCTPVPTHADLVVGAAETGVPDAIHCEKPMADQLADCRRMVEACENADIQLTFNHQRRFAPPRREAKRRLDAGDIGELRRVEMESKNLFDWGTHLVDLCNYYNDEHAAEWVLCGLDYSHEDVRYGAHNESQSVAVWEYENGVHCLATGHYEWGVDAIGAQSRLVGSDGTIEVYPEDDTPLRIRRAGDADPEEPTFDGADLYYRSMKHVVESLDAGTEPATSGRKALRATEIIFGAWESSRRRGRVELPPDIEGNPLAEMVEAGDLDPQ